MILENYINKFCIHKPFLEERPIKGLDLIVTVPIYNEDIDNLEILIESLRRAYKREFKIELIFLVNEPEDPTEIVINKHIEILRFFNLKKKELEEENLRIYSIYLKNIPRKKFGIGNARKILCDEAIFRYLYLGNEKGLIATLDADCFVKENYFEEIIKTFKTTESDFSHIYFEHPFENLKDERLKKGIIYYELFLRFYKNSLLFSDYPFVSYTVGSCFVFKADTYSKFGGFKSKRKAGEDFYFVQKILPNIKFTEIVNTCVYPKARVSERVPFGTGKALKDYIDGKEKFYYSTSFEPFKELKNLKYFIIGEKSLNDLHPLLKEFLLKEKVEREIRKIMSRTKSKKTYIKNFYLWFNLLKVFKFVRFFVQKEEKKIQLEESVKNLIEELGDLQKQNRDYSTCDLLFYLRNYDKKNFRRDVYLFEEFYKKWIEV
ncbi:MAG: glycosyltransferase [Candidatus Hydrothermales bacterium]